MSKAHGSPLQHTWRNLETHGKPDISQEQKLKIAFQLGIITEHLSRLCFNQAGSLLEEDGAFPIKTCLSRGLLFDGRHALGGLYCGLFKYEKYYYNAQISTFVECIKYSSLRLFLRAVSMMTIPSAGTMWCKMSWHPIKIIF